MSKPAGKVILFVGRLSLAAKALGFAPLLTTMKEIENRANQEQISFTSTSGLERCARIDATTAPVLIDRGGLLLGQM